MVIIRCKCGAHFTLDDERFIGQTRKIQCPNCAAFAYLTYDQTAAEVKEAMNAAVFSYAIVPDDTQITWTYHR